MPQRVIDLANRLRCDRIQAANDPKGWFAYVASKAGGRLLGYYHSFPEDVHVGVYTDRKNEIRFMAFRITDGAAERITDSQEVSKLAHTLLDEDCQEAVYLELQRRNYNENVSWGKYLVEDTKQRLMEDSLTPREAAVAVIDDYEHRRRWGLW